MHFRFPLGVVLSVSLLVLSACGHGGGSEAPRGAEPTAPATPAKPAEPNLPFVCVAEGTSGSEAFAYPTDGASSAYEAPTKSFRVELTRVGDSVEMQVWDRNGEDEPYRRAPFPYRYRSDEPINFHYALEATVTPSGMTEIDPWSITCDHANRLSVAPSARE